MYFLLPCLWFQCGGKTRNLCGLSLKKIPMAFDTNTAGAIILPNGLSSIQLHMICCCFPAAPPGPSAHDLLPFIPIPALLLLLCGLYEEKFTQGRSPKRHHIVCSGCCSTFFKPRTPVMQFLKWHWTPQWSRGGSSFSGLLSCYWSYKI